MFSFIKRTARRAAALMFAALFALHAFAPAAHAAEDVTAEADAAAAHLKTLVAEAPGVGDEEAMLALLRGSYITQQQAEVVGYAYTLLSHVQAGGLQPQSIYRTGLQVLVLRAAGIDAEAFAPELVQKLCDTAAIEEEGIRAYWAVLMVFGAAKVPTPIGSSFDALALAESLAARHNEDGGFGTDGETDALTTALAVQALAAFEDKSEAVASASLNAQFWQQLNSNDFGGYNVDGVGSALATAEAMLSVAALSYDPAYISYEAAPMTEYLLSFQNEDGSFSQNSDVADATLSAMCTLALVAKTRYDRGRPGVWDFADVVEMQLEAPTTPDTPDEVPDGGPLPHSAASEATPATTGDNTWLMIVLVVGVVALLTVCIVLYNRRGRKRRY